MKDQNKAHALFVALGFTTNYAGTAGISLMPDEALRVAREVKAARAARRRLKLARKNAAKWRAAYKSLLVTGSKLNHLGLKERL